MSNVKFKNSTRFSILLVVLLIPTFVNLSVAPGRKCWNRTTSDGQTMRNRVGDLFNTAIQHGGLDPVVTGAGNRRLRPQINPKKKIVFGPFKPNFLDIFPADDFRADPAVNYTIGSDRQNYIIYHKAPYHICRTSAEKYQCSNNTGAGCRLHSSIGQQHIKDKAGAARKRRRYQDCVDHPRAGIAEISHRDCCIRPAKTTSRQPAFAPFIVFHITERAPAFAADPEVEFFNVIVFA